MQLSYPRAEFELLSSPELRVKRARFVYSVVPPTKRVSDQDPHSIIVNEITFVKRQHSYHFPAKTSESPPSMPCSSELLIARSVGTRQLLINFTPADSAGVTLRKARHRRPSLIAVRPVTSSSALAERTSIGERR
ncbi:hypothetical protein KOW79_010176 [Hemibagrus wyckioides]|uniref:Uncharacterized protein n=1 Tax=Hemibagrus wyckioides TaxID=337641 RepID=A0A9D3NTE0_9TELE|nr:hypothetical protein KOW79_010176 [Hemibagrus wyckioides]